MKTKAYVAYLNKIPVYQGDIELADAMANLGTIIPDVNKHPRLNKLSLTPKTKAKLFNHLKSTVYGALMKRLYELMMEYFRSIVDCLLVNGLKSELIVGCEERTISERNVLRAGSWEDVCKMITSNVMRSIEGKHDTEKLITTINSRLSLCIPKKVFEAVKPFVEVRHLLVHNSGMADTRFKAKYAGVVRVDHDGSLMVDYKLVKNAIASYGKMIEAYDRALEKSKLLPLGFMQP